MAISITIISGFVLTINVIIYLRLSRHLGVRGRPLLNSGCLTAGDDDDDEIDT